MGHGCHLLFGGKNRARTRDAPGAGEVAHHERPSGYPTGLGGNDSSPRDGRRRPGRSAWAPRNLLWHIGISPKVVGKARGARRPPARGMGPEPRRTTPPGRRVTTAPEVPRAPPAK